MLVRNFKQKLRPDLFKADPKADNYVSEQASLDEIYNKKLNNVVRALIRIGYQNHFVQCLIINTAYIWTVVRMTCVGS